MELNLYLKILGLDEREVKVYLALLELGETPIIPLPKKVSMPRTTVYQILERLRGHGLINIVETKARHIYSPKPPEQVLTLLRNRKNRVEEDIASFSEALPELRRVYKIHPFQPKVRFFPDDDLREIYEEILQAPVDEVWFVSEFEKLTETLGKRYISEWVDRRADKKIWSRVILVDASGLDKKYLNSEKYMRKVRYAPEGFDSPTHTIIYGDNVAIITTTGENFGTVITSREYANTMRDWYRELWKNSSEKPRRK